MAILFCLLMSVVFLQGVDALSSTFSEIYAPGETMIGELGGEILQPISREQVKLKRGHVPISFEYDIKNLGGRYFVWLIAPQSENNYTLTIEDVVTIVDGQTQTIDFEIAFGVRGERIDYNIKPGLIFSSSDFDVTVTLFEDFGKEIAVDFPSERVINLNPGANEIDFSISDIVGTEFLMINLGRYSVPAYLIGGEPPEDFVCGDGEINDSEVCDGENLGGNDCITVGEYIGGVLACSADCLSFDTSQCTIEEDMCDTEHLDLCLNSDDCENAEGYWYGDVCNFYEQGAECDSEHLGLCSSSENCLNEGGYWYNDACNGEQFSGGPKSFRFNPELIRSAILLSEGFPSYKFKIVNTGTGVIEDLYFDFDRTKFEISPSENFSIEAGESLEFDLMLKNFSANVGGEVRDVILAFSGSGVSEFLLLSLSFTVNEDEVFTEYVNEGSDAATAYYCSELAGSICSSGDECSGQEIVSLDGSCCISGVCEEPSSGVGFRAWMGWALAALIVLVLVIVYVRYKKAGKGGKSPLQKRVAGIEKRF